MRKNRVVYALVQGVTVACHPLSTSSGVEIPWKDKIRYLDAFVVQCRKFKCCLDDAKKSFYRAANADLGKIGRIASEEVILEIIRCKCIPILLYGTGAFMLNKSELSSLDFVINRLFMKLFKTNNIETVEFCQDQFGFDKPSVLCIVFVI